MYVVCVGRETRERGRERDMNTYYLALNTNCFSTKKFENKLVFLIEYEIKILKLKNKIPDMEIH